MAVIVGMPVGVFVPGLVFVVGVARLAPADPGALSQAASAFFAHT